MEGEDKVDPVYLKGFNEGYTIAEHMPELAQVLANVEGKSERLNGLKAGQSQYHKDQAKEIKKYISHKEVPLPDWLKRDRSIKERKTPAKSKGRNIEPDKD